MTYARRRSVDSPHFHVWTDALHARQLAKDTANDWDRGTYVRWTIQSAWTAFEWTCEIALSTSGLGNQFRRRFDEAMAAAGNATVDWGSGLWQRVLEVYQLRKDYIHPRIPQARLFSPLQQAEKAVTTLRAAIEDLHNRLGITAPEWIYDDVADGWQGRRTVTDVAHATLIRAGAKRDDPNAVIVAYVYKGEEHISEVLPPGSDPRPVMEALIDSIVVPISEVRAYHGEKLIESVNLKMRGA